MATATKRRKNSVTKFLQDIIDDSKELVDDLIDRAAVTRSQRSTPADTFSRIQR
jgi:hypothetical protein